VRIFARLFPTACFMLGILFGAVVMACSTSDSGGSCTEALTAAEVVMQKQTNVIDAVTDAIDSFAAGDSAGISAANARIAAETVTATKDQANYERLAAECRGN
jgi:UDP-N-acetylglucosamine 2-epimerase